MDVTQDGNPSVEAANADQEITDNQQTESTPEVTVTTREPVKYDTHKRVLDEAKGFKKRAQDAERRLEEINRAKLEEQGKHKELAETFRSQLDQQRSVNMKLAVRMAVANPASKAGCVDLDDLLKLGDESLLEYDPETGEVFGADNFVEAMKTKRPYLFQQPQRPVTNPAVPGGAPVETKKEKSFEESLGEFFKK